MHCSSRSHTPSPQEGITPVSSVASEVDGTAVVVDTGSDSVVGSDAIVGLGPEVVGLGSEVVGFGAVGFGAVAWEGAGVRIWCGVGLRHRDQSFVFRVGISGEL
jgi:hypothetical protein